jgi:hypothetical protein
MALSVPTSTNGQAADPGPPSGINVNVVNAPLPVREVDVAAKSAFQVTLTNLTPGTTDQFTVPTTVPGTSVAVNRLVIEFASGSCEAAQLNPGAFLLTTVVGGTSVQHGLRMEIPPPQTALAFMTERTVIYADPNTVMSVNFFAGHSGSIVCNMALSGHFAPQ